METLWQDLRYGFRWLARSPGFTAVVILTLALGIGANTAVFSIVNAVLLRPLPYPDFDRLVMIWNEYNGAPSHNSVPDFADRQEQSETLERVAAFDFRDVNLTGRGDPLRIRGGRVTGEFFSVLGVEPTLGRIFLAEEYQPGVNAVVILDHGCWEGVFGGDPGIIGKIVTLNDLAFTVVGVMPEGFRSPISRVDLWTPIGFTSQQKSDANRGNEYLWILGRMRRDFTLDQVEAEMDAIAARVPDRDPERREYLLRNRWDSQVVPLRQQLVGDFRSALLVLQGAVAFVLLIGCVNVANLFLSRGSTRQKELAIRRVMGAGRVRLIRQMLTESLLLSVAGGGLGLLLAQWGIDFLATVAGPEVTRMGGIRIDSHVLGFSLLLSLATGVLFGLVPALSSSRVNFHGSLKVGGWGSRNAGQQKLRRILVSLEVALAMVLLVGAGLLMNSFLRILRVDPGFQSSGRLTMTLSLPASRYSQGQQGMDFFGELLPRLESLPGVRSVGVSHLLPFSGENHRMTFHVEGLETPPGEKSPGGSYRFVYPGYFRAMGIPMLRGRTFDLLDAGENRRVILIDARSAKKFWPDQDPIGRRMRFTSENWYEVVGVVGSVKNSSLITPGMPQVYLPISPQRLTSRVSLVIHADLSPQELVPAIREEVLAIDPVLPIYDIRTMDERIAESVASRRFSMQLLGLFGGIGLILAILGIYGVISFSVDQKINEIGVRMAIGAQTRDILLMVFRQGMILILAGVILGLAGSLALTRVLSGFLFDVTPMDPATYAGVSVILVAVALLACYLPARRATRVDPMVALRYE